jgi:hypothetical protein
LVDIGDQVGGGFHADREPDEAGWAGVRPVPAWMSRDSAEMVSPMRSPVI